MKFVRGDDMVRLRPEQIDQMDAFLERLIEVALSDIERQVQGLARDFAEEVVDMLADTKIELGEFRALLARPEPVGGAAPK